MESSGTHSTCIVFDRETGEARRVERATLATELEDDGRFAWVDLQGPDIGALKELATELGLEIDPERVFGSQEILPRLTEAPDHGTFYLYEVLHPERHLAVDQGLTPIEVVRLVVVLSKRVVLTFHRRDVEAVQDVQAECAHAFRLAGRSPCFVVFLLLQESLYDIAHLNLANDNYLDQLQSEVAASEETVLPADVTVAGHNILVLKKLATSLHIVLMRLGTKKTEFVSDAARESFVLIMQNAISVRGAVDSSRDLLDGILASIQTAAANRTSEIARVLTIISGVLLPITVVAGIYGMNFQNMPELSHPYGYFGALGLMALIAAGQLLVFRRLGWIGHPKQLVPGGDSRPEA
jgi:magnesium transporter